MNAFYGTTNNPNKVLKEQKGKVAVIGMGCRFPGANNLKEYWDLLINGKCATRELPESRAPLDFRVENKHKRPICGYIDGIDLFDPLFFGITPREAMRMDPQQRLLLEVLWEAIEDAGIDVKDYAGYDTGVFIGAGAMFASAHYFMHQINNKTADIYSYTGAEGSTLANKISYLFDFRGPCFAIDSACSSSLTIIDEAYIRICSGQCNVAVVGSSNLLLSSSITDMFQNTRVLTTDGKCKAFDEKADGYARGEGAGVVILKSLEKALEDRNDIWAVISGTAVNHGGRNGRGFTYPNSEAQESLLKSAYKHANILPSKVHYIEAHGTATPVGDEIELTGIRNAISEGRADGDLCKIGSVKTNIGHLEYAAGVAALIKTCLMLKNKKLVPSLNFHNFKKNAGMENARIKVQTKFEPWPDDKKLIAGVSSFGIGGSNAHVVLESIEYYASNLSSEHKQEISRNKQYVFPMSSHNMDALRDNAKNYIRFIELNNDLDFYDICYSVSVHKNHLSHRLGILCQNKQELVSKLKKFVNEQDYSSVFYSNASDRKSKNLAFVFSDSKSKWLDEKTLLLFNEMPILEALKEVDTVYQSIYGKSLQVIMNEMDYELIETQPMLTNVYYFIYQIALYYIWREKGIIPTRLVGYRQGEIAAAYLAGILPLATAIRLIALHTQTESDASYRSFNVMASIDELNEIVCNYNKAVFISAVNSPNIQEVSVKNEYVEQFMKDLDDKEYYYKELKDNINETDSQSLDGVNMLEIHAEKANFKVYSTTVNSKGEFIDLSEQNWKEKGRRTINFSKRICELIEDDCYRFIEIGNDTLLSFYISDIFQSVPSRTEREVVISSNNKETSIEDSVTQGIAELYTVGYPIDWTKIYKDGNFIKMPSYAWQRQSYWI
nr:type I polyketide synthase [uncultured Lachnoclostridium sp.]